MRSTRYFSLRIPLFYLLIFSGNVFAANLGAHTLLGQEEGSGANPAVTAPINTQLSGSTLIAFNAGYASNNSLPTDNKGNTWVALGSGEVYRGYNGAFDVKPYVVENAQGGSGHRVSIVKNGNASGELTLPLIEIQNANVHAWVKNYPANANSVTSADITTTGPAILLAFWWGDAGGLMHTASPNNGFTVIESFLNLPPNSAVQSVVAFRQVISAGTYNVSWTHAPSQGAPLWLIALQTPENDLVFQNSFE